MRLLSWARPCLQVIPRLQRRLPINIACRTTLMQTRIWQTATRPRSFAEASSSKQIEIKVPSLGDSITEGEIIEVAKQHGSAVSVDEVVAVLETDKVSVDIRAEHAGIVASVNCQPGQTVKIGDVLFTLDKDPETASRPHPSSPPSSHSDADELTRVKASEGRTATAQQSLPVAPKPSSPDPAASPSSGAQAYEPLIQFRYGIRDGSASVSKSAVVAMDDNFRWVPTPPKYRRLQVLQIEIDAIESGGATLKSLYS